MTNKFFILLFLFTDIFILQAQNNLNGKIVDIQGNPISFVNVGILNKGVGTVSDEYGNFTLSFGNDLLFDTMAMSCIGFKFKKYVVKSFLDSNSKNRKITMEKEIVQLKEVLIKGTKLKPYEIGHFTENWKLLGYMTSKATGSELATLIHQEKNWTVHLVGFKFNIVTNNFDSLRFRINIYSVKDQMPDSNLLQGNEIFLLVKERFVFKYYFKKDIFITGDFILSLELLDIFGQENSKKKFEFSTVDGGTSYKRYTSHDRWEKLYGASLGYGLIVN